LIDAVDLRLGDARESLAEIEGLVDLAFLDGRNDLYLEVLTRLEPRLSERAVIVADLSPNDPDLTAYLEYVRSRSFSRIELPVETGFEVSVLV
jgi:predicted O-methyltransferase YrrM